MVTKLGPFAPKTLGTLSELLEARRTAVAHCLEDLRVEIADAMDQRDVSDLLDDDEPAADTDAERCLMLADRADGALREIEDALARVAAGRYGYCADCGGRIPLQRLRALPATRTCVECSRRRGHPDGESPQHTGLEEETLWGGFDPEPRRVSDARA